MCSFGKALAKGRFMTSMLICIKQVSSIGLAVTNIIGVPVGGLGVPMETLSEAKAERFYQASHHHAQ